MVVRGRKLVDQASKRLFRENVPHGVLMAGHWAKNALAPIQVCSIDTMIARDEWPEADIVVIDEAHMATSNGYKELAKVYEGKFILGVTATPYTKEPLSHLFSEVVAPISVQELINRGFLVKPRYFAPSKPDMKGVKVQNGEYNTEQSFEKMSVLTGDIIEHYRRFGEGRPTICFAVNIAHSKRIAEQFGPIARHIDADSTDKEREEAIRDLTEGKIKILSNVGILCTGVDIPPVSCIIMARPTRSLNLYIQQAGRGTRTFENKKDFLILDHAGNIARHGFITEQHEVDLDGFKKEKGPSKPKTCEECYCMYYGKHCPECGHEPKVQKRVIEIAPGVLKEITEADPVLRFIAQRTEEAKRKGYKKGWVYHCVRENYGEDVANKMFPVQALQARRFGKRHIGSA